MQTYNKITINSNKKKIIYVFKLFKFIRYEINFCTHAHICMHIYVSDLLIYVNSKL